MNWTELKIDAFRIVEDLAKDDNVPKEQKLEELKKHVRPLLEEGLEGIIETLPAGFEQAVKAVYDHGGRDFVMLFLVPLVSEEIYQVWKMLHKAPAAPADKPAAKPAAKAASK